MRVGIVAVSLPILLGGCLPVLPPVVSAISTAMTGASIVMHGKTGSDQVLSVAVNQDCAMYRVAIGEEMCREFQEGERPPEATLVNNFPGDMDDQAGDDSAPETPMEVVLAEKGVPFDLGPRYLPVTAKTEVEDEDPVQVSTLVSNLVGAVPIPQPRTVTIAGIVAEADRLQVGRVQADPMPLVPVSFAPISEEAVLEPAASVEAAAPSQGAAPVLKYSWTPSTPAKAKQATATAKNNASKSATAGLSADQSLAPVGHYVILGSFRSVDRAAQLAAEHASVDTHILRVKISDTTWHRVAAGPLSETKAAEMEEALKGKLSRAPWTIRTTEPTPTTVALLD